MNDSPEDTTARPRWLLPTPARRDEPQGEAAPLRALLLRLMRGEDLRRAEAAALLDALLDGAATDAQIAAALVALAVKGETVEELSGMAAAMRGRAVRLASRHARFIDTAGTGSSGAKTFNVSTAAAFVVAGAGLPVAKHGSRAATSRSGSADVLTALGVNVSVAPEVSERCLNETGICFMFAPLYHGATARVAGVRRELGVHTTFNLLGPLTNPAGAPRQIIGVWHRALVEPLARALLELGTERAWVVHGLDGLDEVTLADKTLIAEARGDADVRAFEIAPEDFGQERATLEGLRGGDAAANARIIREVLDGKRRDAARALVVVNAAAALLVGGAAENLKDGARLASDSIDTGAARAKLEQLARATNA
ncbi:MAG TPA: anthranilate phosphoribosyltransferase [Pyrinomonadaceae bacterium]|jgi:anthranilate phosphoribosyltransferase|nr:anthranilate phosphoribosyltransferase [Pyrinomonadaceae bacterium]